MDADVLYRYENHGDVVILEQYPVVKRTPCGAWINVRSKRRFILAGTFKKFACATEEDARVSFFARKARQLKILRARGSPQLRAQCRR